ncbi:MAG: HdeD family acid-resistance protein [Candidatus Promineifilaceae bacterium]|jgi:uncharacterized membrane protein HdeD (DUF308 family)
MSSDSFSGENAVWANVKLPPWWLVLIEGILFIILGIFFFTSPYRTMVTAVWALGIFWIVQGIFELVSLIWDRSMWGWKIFAGILGLVAGWIIFQQPLAGSLVLSATLVFFLGFIGLFQGISSLIQGFKGAGLGAILVGIFIIILSIILLMNVQGAAAWMPWALGFMAIFAGISALFGAFRIRSVEKAL